MQIIIDEESRINGRELRALLLSVRASGPLCDPDLDNSQPVRTRPPWRKRLAGVSSLLNYLKDKKMMDSKCGSPSTARRISPLRCTGPSLANAASIQSAKACASAAERGTGRKDKLEVFVRFLVRIRSAI
jgi:hypothetical protein